MVNEHAEIQKAAAERFAAAHGRWPRSLDELDPFGMRGFGTASVVGFEHPADDELCLRYVHKGGKTIVRVRRQPELHG